MKLSVVGFSLIFLSSVLASAAAIGYPKDEPAFTISTRLSFQPDRR